jgi:DNA-binding transcriptional LysR family regulator
MALFLNEGAQPRIVQEVTDVVTSIALVSSGFGICVAPQATSNLKLPGVVYRPIKANPVPSIEFACLYRSDDESPILTAILEVTRKFRPTYGE